MSCEAVVFQPKKPIKGRLVNSLFRPNFLLAQRCRNEILQLKLGKWPQ